MTHHHRSSSSNHKVKRFFLGFFHYEANTITGSIVVFKLLQILLVIVIGAMTAAAAVSFFDNADGVKTALIFQVTWATAIPTLIYLLASLIILHSGTAWWFYFMSVLDFALTVATTVFAIIIIRQALVYRYCLDPGPGKRDLGDQTAAYALVQSMASKRDGLSWFMKSSISKCRQSWAFGIMGAVLAMFFAVSWILSTVIASRLARGFPGRRRKSSRRGHGEPECDPGYEQQVHQQQYFQQ